jgi:hypothetical protein
VARSSVVPRPSPSRSVRVAIAALVEPHVISLARRTLCRNDWEGDTRGSAWRGRNAVGDYGAEHALGPLDRAATSFITFSTARSFAFASTSTVTLIRSHDSGTSLTST